MDPNQDFLYDSEFPNSYHRDLKPWQRLYLHYTDSSLQKQIHLKSCTMKDRLDFILSATYQHNKELFPDELDIYLQPVTVGLVVQKKSRKIISDLDTEEKRARNLLRAQRTLILAKRIYPEHPLIIGGIKERIHPSSIKLMNSSHHQPQTNAGYIRQDRDGNVFQY